MRTALSARWCPRLAWVLTLILVGAWSAPAGASEALRKELAGVARSLADLLKGRGEESIAIGQFNGPPSLPTSSGPGIAQILAEELKKQGIAVKPRAKLGLTGEFRATEVPSESSQAVKLLAVRLKGTVEDNFGAVLTQFSFDRTIPGEETFVQVMGTPVTLDPKDPPEVRDKTLREGQVEPKAQVRGTRIAAGPDSPYAIEILVGGTPRPARDEEGLPFVTIARGETYAVRLINDSSSEAAVRLSIDGLNLYTFSTLRKKDGPHKGEPLYDLVIVRPGESVVIPGWHVTNEKSDEFLVTEYAKSAAGSLNSTANVGTITATFAVAWPADLPPPSDEAPRKKGSPDATGFGARRDVKYVEIGPRSVGAIRASISVRYSK
jgi:hypothetical protein